MASQTRSQKVFLLWALLGACLLQPVGMAADPAAVKDREQRMQWWRDARHFLPLVELWPFTLMVAFCMAVFAIARGKPSAVLALFSGVLCFLLLLAVFSTGKVALWVALGTGLFNSIMWSNIFTLAIDDLGEHTSQGSSLLVMMIVGGALLPLLMGAIGDAFGIRMAFLTPIPCYLYIVFYGWWSHRRIAAKGSVA